MSETKLLHDDDIIKSEDGLIFNPYNPLNIEISLNDVQSILTKYGIPPVVKNIALYKRAFVHRSYTKRPNIENDIQNITIVPRPPDCLPLSTKHCLKWKYVGVMNMQEHSTTLWCKNMLSFPLTHFLVESQGSKEKFTHSHKNFFFHQNKDFTQATFTQLLNLPILPKAEKLFTSFLIFSFSTSLRFTSL